MQFAQDTDQVAAHRAANAAIVHLDDLLIAVLHQQVVVDAGFAELVFDHSDAVAVLLLEDAVEQSGFTASQKAGEDGDGDQRHGDFRFNLDSFLPAQRNPESSVTGKRLVLVVVMGTCSGSIFQVIQC